MSEPDGPSTRTTSPGSEIEIGRAPRTPRCLLTEGLGEFVGGKSRGCHDALRKADATSTASTRHNGRRLATMPIAVAATATPPHCLTVTRMSTVGAARTTTALATNASATEPTTARAIEHAAPGMTNPASQHGTLQWP